MSAMRELRSPCRACRRALRHSAERPGAITPPPRTTWPAPAASGIGVVADHTRWNSAGRSAVTASPDFAPLPIEETPALGLDVIDLGDGVEGFNCSGPAAQTAVVVLACGLSEELRRAASARHSAGRRLTSSNPPPARRSCRPWRPPAAPRVASSACTFVLMPKHPGHGGRRLSQSDLAETSARSRAWPTMRPHRSEPWSSQMWRRSPGPLPSGLKDRAMLVQHRAAWAAA